MPLLPAYYTTTSTKKRKPNKKNSKAQEEHNAWLRSMGIGAPKKRVKTKWDAPRLSTEQNVTSDSIPGNGSKKKQNQYTGDEIMGVALHHKSNYVPVRKDNKAAAVESAQMRRN